jgi:hypothetical protein
MKLQKGVCVLLFLITSSAFALKHARNLGPGEEDRPAEVQRAPLPLEDEEYLMSHRSYEEIIDIFGKWESGAPDLVDSGYYGRTSKGTEIFYVKITNEFRPGEDVILLTACIHGNEPWSTSTMMGYVGKLLSSYGKDERITKILNEKTIYFVPVVSPDTYGRQRRVDGVDPNRDFPTLKNPQKESAPPVQSLRDFFLEIRPRAALSGHTFGRVFLVPWGDSRTKNPNEEDYRRVASEMSDLAGYRWMNASKLYGSPIVGTEIDWYHRNGAFAMVMEFGTHQRHPSLEDTKTEFDRTLDAFLFFLEESTGVDIYKGSVGQLDDDKD